ncbi:hypothetical protein BJV74DRAFT_798726 [Russula compacta]|nr:hypothetical protein BJV74DRAFT_798726 [Russula compacta]
MLVLASVVSMLATLSLASSVGTREDHCPHDGVQYAPPFTLLAVDRTNTSDQEPLALTAKGTLTPTPLTDDESSNTIIAKNFTMKDGGITAYAPNGSVVAVSDGVHAEISVITFTLTNNATAVPPGKEYCRLINSGFEGAQFPDELAILVHGESKNFALCHFLHEAPILTYRDAGLNHKSVGFSWAGCKGVYVYMLRE